MAYPVVASSNVATANGGPTVTAPTGIAVGDLLFAYVVSNNGTVSAPAGWTQIKPAGSSNSASFYKVADAGDAAASTFSFGGGTRTVAIMARITGNDGALPVDAANNGTATGTALSATGIVPQTQDLLLMCGGGWKTNNGGSMTISSPAIANSNPSWNTAQSGRATDTGNDAYGIVFYANMSGLAATGTGTATATDASSVANDLHIIAIRQLQIIPAVLTLTGNVSAITLIKITIVGYMTSATSILQAVMQEIKNKFTDAVKHVASWVDTTKH